MARLSVDQEAVAMMVSSPLHTAVGRDFSGVEEPSRPDHSTTVVPASCLCRKLSDKDRGRR